MINGTQLKICGLTTLVDAQLADDIGADYLGFILWPKSPRAITLATFHAIVEKLPMRKKVGVLVEPAMSDLTAAINAGFDRFQIHFPHTTPLAHLREWSDIVGPKRLWFAPKLPPQTDIAPEWLPLADAFLLDTFSKDPAQYGGTGETGDWEKFKRHRENHPNNLWILAGGLTPDNIGEALDESGAHFADANSGIESAPGVKDPEKLQALKRALRER